ncbi:hypothetical protein GCM10027605_48750 [Micromonospora zhanjiangensis]
MNCCWGGAPGWDEDGAPGGGSNSGTLVLLARRGDLDRVDVTGSDRMIAALLLAPSIRVDRCDSPHRGSHPDLA